jgi:ABC-type Fe3+-hydroxamate transport system substrate-binding protein
VRATALTGPCAAAEREAWATLASVPAVRQRRVYLLSGDYLVVPRPRLVEATEAFAHTLHPDAFK